MTVVITEEVYNDQFPLFFVIITIFKRDGFIVLDVRLIELW